MKVVRWLFSLIFIFLLVILFYIGVPLAATTQVFTNRENVKEIIDTSGIFENFTDIFVDLLSNIEIENGSGNMGGIITLLQEDSEFKDNIETILTSDEMQESVDAVIDSFYDWLEGKSDTLDFEIYLIEDEETFRKFFGSIMMLQLENLPECETYDDAYSYILDTSYPSSYSNGTDMNTLFEIECLPPSIDLDDVETLLTENLDSDEMDMQEMMETFKFSSDQLNISESNTEMVQNIYKIAKIFPLLLAGSILLLTIILILLVPGAKASFITSSIIYLLAGISLLAISFIGNINQLMAGLTTFSNVEVSYGQIEPLLTTFITPILQMITGRLKIYSLIVIGLGVVFLVIGIVVKTKDKDKEEVKQSTEKTDNSKS